MASHVTDPTAATWLVAMVAFLSPSPLAMLLKGAIKPMQIPVTEIKTALTGAQGLVKLGLEFVPGTTPEEKTAKVLEAVEPVVKVELDTLNLPPMVQGIALKFLEWIVAAEVRAAEAA